MATISLEKLVSKTTSIYEAVVIMAKRARQINDEQKLEIEMDMDTVSMSENKDNEDFDEVDIDREALMWEHIKYPKPSRVAIEEMLDDEIEYQYDEPEEQENQ